MCKLEPTVHTEAGGLRPFVFSGRGRQRKGMGREGFSVVIYSLASIHGLRPAMRNLLTSVPQTKNIRREN